LVLCRGSGRELYARAPAATTSAPPSPGKRPPVLPGLPTGTRTPAGKRPRPRSRAGTHAQPPQARRHPVQLCSAPSVSPVRASSLRPQPINRETDVRLILPALAIATLVLTSCGPQEGGCTKDTDCASGRVCSARECVDRSVKSPGGGGGGSPTGGGSSCGTNHCGGSCPACPSSRSFCNKIAIQGDDRTVCGECPQGDSDYCERHGYCVHKETGGPCSEGYSFRCTRDTSTSGTVCDCAYVSCQFKWN
jgi:hypothetical protein